LLSAVKNATINGSKVSRIRLLPVSGVLVDSSTAAMEERNSSRTSANSSPDTELLCLRRKEEE
jgi:hypothetical protein